MAGVAERLIDPNGKLGFAFDALRIVTGAVLVAGSVQYILSQSSAMLVVEEINFDFVSPTVLVPSITLLELVGGILLTFGLLTRTAAALQIPLFLIFFLGHELRTDVPGISYPLWFDIVVFIVILFFVAKGSGTFSVDRYLRDKQLEAISQAVYEPENETNV